MSIWASTAKRAWNALQAQIDGVTLATSNYAPPAPVAWTANNIPTPAMLATLASALATTSASAAGTPYAAGLSSATTA